MAKKHKIKQGESLLELAYEGGFDSWKRIWNDPANAELRELRKDPQVLLPGDEVAVPELQTTPKERCPVDKVHRFRLVRPRAWVNLRILDGHGEPLGGMRFELRIGTAVETGTTDDQGELSVEVSPNDHEGRLRLWNEGPAPCFEAVVRVGHLDPASSPSGMLARLVNLGAERVLSPSLRGRAPISASDLLFKEDLRDAVGDDPTSRIESLHDKRE